MMPTHVPSVRSGLRPAGPVAALSCVVGCLGGMVGTAAAEEIPESLENIVFGDEKQPRLELDINGTSFDAIATFASTPYLLWLSEDAPSAPFDADVEAASAWLTEAAAALGFAGFSPRFHGVSSWRLNEVWVFELRRAGLALHDARVEVHLEGGAFVGLVVHLPGDLVEIVDRDVPEGEEWVYFPVRRGARTYRAEPLRVRHVDHGDRVEIVIDAPDGLHRRIVQNPGVIVGARGVEFVEYDVPGVFPDQISIDECGIVWLSQPNNNFVTEFDPISGEFIQHPATGGSGPDGLIVGTQRRVWTGLYFGGGLGMYDINEGTFDHWNAPYSPSAMAIPVETSDGHVWVTDHNANRISEFDPDAGIYVQSLLMPTPACWVVQGYEDRDAAEVYYTQYNANQLGRHAVGGSSIMDIPIPGGGPAFCVVLDGIVYYSRWTESGIGAYDAASGQVTEYQFPVAGETGGPMWLTPDGRIVTGTRNIGFIMVFDPATGSFDPYQIPTSFPGLKDGLTVADDGTIWFTESGVDKLGKLTLLAPPCAGDVNGDGFVNTGDLLALLADWGADVSCPPYSSADFDQDCDVDTQDLLALLAAWGAC